MLLQAGVKDGGKLNIAETTAFREHQAQAQAAQEQEALTQQQQAQAVQQVSMQKLKKQLAVSTQLLSHEPGLFPCLHGQLCCI